MSFFRKQLLACFAGLFLAFSAAWGAVGITNTQVTNIGTTTFTVVWTTSDVSTPGLEVFADAAGATAITSTLGLDYYPIAEGDPAVVNSATARAGRRALETLAINRRVVSVRVTGLSPGTTYYVRPRTFDTSGVDNGAAVAALTPATTAQFTSMVTDARILRIRIPTFAAEGMILLVQGPAGTTPLSAIIGDSAADNVAFFSSAHVLDTTTGTTALFTAPQPFVVRVIGAGAPAGTFTQTINFGSSFVVAKQDAFDAAIESPAPFITTHPTNKTVVAGATATFTVAATGTPAPTYKWQRKPAGGSLWTDLAGDSTYSGVTTTTLSVASATVAMTGDQFRAVASNGIPSDAISDAAILTVTAAAVAPTITTQPQPVSVLAGLNATFSVVATGTPEPTYVWQRKPAGGDTWGDLTEGAGYTGVATANLAVVNATLAMSGDQFRVVVTNGVLPNVTSSAVALTVGAATVAPTFTTQPLSKSVAAGANTTFTVAASGTPTPTFKWQIKLAGTSTWLDLTETSNYTGVTTASMTVKSATVAMTGDQFRVVAANGTLPDATSEVATLTVLAPPAITGQPQSASVGTGASATFTVTATGTGSLGYLWQRRAAGSADWLDLANSATYTGVTTGTLKVNNALLVMSGDQFRCVVTDTIGSTTSHAATLTVTAGAATITLSKLRQSYDGTPRAVVATTSPAGLTVTFTYNGSATPPSEPGIYAVTAQIQDANYSGSTTGELIVTTTVLVRQAPTIAGGVDGSVHVVSPADMTITGWISGDLLVRGTPNVMNNGTPTIGGIREGTGAVEPSNYGVTFANTAALRYLVRRVDAVTMPTVATPPAPTGTRIVTLTTATQTPGDFATLRNLSLSGTAGMVVVPPGTYGNLTTNGATGFILGVAGATEPAVYNIQSLSLNTLRSTARITVVGPVILNVATTAGVFGELGSPEHPEWLTLTVASGTMSANGKLTIYGSVIAPTSAVSLSGGSVIKGNVIADRLSITADSEVKSPAQP